MKNNIILIVLGLILTIASCSIDEVINPNNPNLNDLLADPSENNLNLMVAGLEARARDTRGSFIIATGSIARELYFFNSSDPTSTATLLGKDGATLTGSEPQLTGFMGARYSAVKSAEFILQMADLTTDPDITEAEKQGYRGIANTFKAYSLLEVLSLVNSNGIRVEVKDPENLGPVLSQTASYQAIRDLLDEALTQLQGAEFAFQLSPGFENFDTPATFALFNRAIAARTALYQENYEDALSLVNDSFLDLNGDLTVGPNRQYGQNGFEIVNPVFKSPGQSGDQFVVHDRFIDDIQTGDSRINKFRLRPEPPVARDGLNGTHESALYVDNTIPIDHIRNEELVLIYAEANIQAAGGDLQEAEDALNIIRNAYGLDDYSGAQTVDELTDEMLYNRSYSLWGEGHTMFDLRRYDRLNSTFLPLDREDDLVHTEFPLPPFDR